MKFLKGIKKILAITLIFAMVCNHFFIGKMATIFADDKPATIETITINVKNEQGFGISNASVEVIKVTNVDQSDLNNLDPNEVLDDNNILDFNEVLNETEKSDNILETNENEVIHGETLDDSSNINEMPEEKEEPEDIFDTEEIPNINEGSEGILDTEEIPNINEGSEDVLDTEEIPNTNEEPTTDLTIDKNESIENSLDVNEDETSDDNELMQGSSEDSKLEISQGIQLTDNDGKVEFELEQLNLENEYYQCKISAKGYIDYEGPLGSDLSGSIDITLSRKLEREGIEFEIKSPSPISYTPNAQFTNKLIGDFDVEYSIISSHDVGTIDDSSTGVVTIHKPGKITVKAVIPEDGIYNEYSIIYELEIKKANNSQLTFDSNCKKELSYGDKVIYKASGGLGSGAIKYRIVEGNGIASINPETGELIATNIGTVKIRATKEADDFYEGTSTELFEIKIGKKNIHIEFPIDSITIEYGQKEPNIQEILKAYIESKMVFGDKYNSLGEDWTLPRATINNNIINVRLSGPEYYSKYSFTCLNNQQLNIIRVFDGKNCYTITGGKNNGWYTTPVKIEAKTGYKVSTSDMINGYWATSIEFWKENTDIPDFYIRREPDGAISKAIQENLKVDKEKPKNIKIEYENIPVKTFDDVRLFDSPITVKISAEDMETGVQYFEYNYILPSGKSIKGGQIKEIVKSGNLYSASFIIEEDFIGKLEIKAIDQAENVGEKTTDYYISLDRQAPIIHVSFDQNNDNKAYKKRVASIRIEENNLDLNQSKIIIKNEKGEDVSHLFASELKLLKSRDEEGVYTANIQFKQDGAYVLEVHCIDYMENSDKNISESFIVDSTPAEFRIEYDNNNVKNNKFYSAGRKATIHVKEERFDSERIKLVVSKDGILDDTYKEDELEWTKVNESDEYKVILDFTSDAEYSYHISYTDLAGNSAEKSESFIIDKTQPEIFVSFSNEKDIKPINEIYYAGKRKAEILIYEKNFKEEDFVFNIKSKNLIGQDIEKPVIRWDFTDRSKHQYRVTIEFNYDANYEFSVSYSDLAGNSGRYKKDTDEAFLSSYTLDKFVIDTVAPDPMEISYNGNPFRKFMNTITFKAFFKDYISVKIRVGEEVAGLDSLSYAFKGNNETNDEIKWYSISGNELDKKRNDKYYTISFNIEEDNKGHIIAEAIDKAGNKSTNRDEDIVLDNIPPVIEVEYLDDITPKNEKYYNKVRKAKIKIIEENFYEDGVKFEIYKDNVITKSLEPTEWNEEDGGYISYIDFEEDGIYHYSIACKDNSGNEASVYQEKEFIINTTIPTIQIEYPVSDNTNHLPVKDSYYNNQRVAEITITDNTFSVDGVNITIMNTDICSNNLELPQISPWESDGNQHKASIYFEKDGNYVFDIEYMNLAGSMADDYPQEVFTIDRELPSNLHIEYKKNGKEGPYTFNSSEMFFNDKVIATVAVEDNISGIESIQYRLISDVKNNFLDDSSGEINDLVFEGNKAIGLLEILPQFTGYVEITAMDKTRNTMTAIDSKKIIIDNVKPIIKVEFDNNLVMNQMYYNSPRIAKITIQETNFYPEDVKFDVLKENDTTKSLEVAQLLIPKIDSWKKVEGKIDTYETSIHFEEDGKYSLAVHYEDKSGNIADPFTEETFIIDRTAPVINVDFSKTEAYNEKYYQNDRTVTIKITEKHFFAEDVEINVIYNGNKSNSYSNNLSWKPVDGIQDTYTSSITFSEDGIYEFSISYKDRAGNAGNSYAEKEFIIDKTKPEIDVHYSNNKSVNGNYYDANRQATIRIKEVNFSKEDVSISILAGDINGNTKKVPIVDGWTTNGDIHTATIDYMDDATYTFSISVKDLANNVSSPYEEEVFTIDKVNPNIADEGITFIKKGDKSFERIINFITFGYFYNERIDVKIRALDETSGVQSISYYIVNEDTKESIKVVNNDKKNKSEQVISFKLQTDFKGYVYASATDFAGNKINDYVKSNGVVLESQNSHKSKGDKINIIPMNQPNENGFYNSDVSVELSVQDQYSGIHTLGYKVGVSEPVSLNFNSNEDVTYEWKKIVTVNAAENNNNHVVVKVDYQDNTGNQIALMQTYEEIYKIDVTKPVIDVRYDTDNFINETYLNTKRVATITIDELNFNPKDIVYTLTKDGTEIDSILPSASNWRREGTKNIANIVFDIDGDYTFNISYTDLAGNKAEYNRLDEFTIDLTDPIIGIDYDNNEVHNGYYYNDDRIATITIMEHNFEPDKVDIVVSATDRDAEKTPPISNGWISVGDTHKTSIIFNEDAKYTLDISYIDKAGNQANLVERNEFVIDKTTPEINITMIEDRSANSGQVEPLIEFYDTNFSPQNVSIALTGSRRGEIAIEGTRLTRPGGLEYKFNNFLIQEEVDDLYTLSTSVVDLAGNEMSKIITFSVNRFGSVYILSEETIEIVGKFINKERNITVKEVNVDYLDHHSIQLRRDGNMIDLSENVDYKVDLIGDEDSWKEYVYTVYSKNLTQEGNYEVMFYSEDKATNLSDNKIKRKDIKFSIDKTKPTCIITGVEANKAYNLDDKTINMVINDNLSLDNVKVLLNNELLKEWNHQEILEIGSDFEITIPSSNERQSLEIIYGDAANNIGSTKIEKFLITSNPWVQFYQNKKLLYSTLTGGATLSFAGISIFRKIRLRRKMKMS